MSGRVTIAIAKTPMSLNQWMSKHWRVRHKDKSAWVEELNYECHRANLPTCDSIEASVTFRFKDRRRRDVGNFSSTLEKCLGDALRPDFIQDDDSSRFQVIKAGISPEVGPAETIIVLDWHKAEELAA